MDDGIGLSNHHTLNIIVPKDRMKNKLKALFLSKIRDSKKEPVDISSYSMVRSGTGLWTNKIYWKGKAKEGSTASILIRLNNDIVALKLAIDAMEEIITEATAVEIDFGQPLVEYTKTQNEGW